METLLKETPVSMIYADSSGAIWLGTFNAGILRYKDGQFYPISIRNGLATDVIYNILEDERGDFWLTSDTGIHRVKKNDLNEIVEGKTERLNCISYGISDGMGSIECTHYKSSVLETSKGEFWFASKKGISVLNPEKIKRRTLSPPNVVIEKIDMGEQIFEGIGKEYVFQDSEKIGLFFTACSFAAPKRVKFRYKLEGHDENWIQLESDESREAFYANLDPGSYVFRVSACNDEGIWNRNESRVSIKIRSYFTNTWMFRALLVMAVFVTGTGSYLVFRRRRLLKNKRSKSPILDPGKTEQCLKHLGYLLEVKKIYKDEKISLQSLSEKLSIPPYQFSQIINTRLNKNFFDLINSFRIQEAKEQLTDPAKSQLTILEIAYDVGFNSKVSFNKAFKKFTKMTPSQFRKEHKSH